MISEVKHLIRVPGCMPCPETPAAAARVVKTHACFASLYAAVSRDGMPIIAIVQGSLEITDGASYAQLKSDKSITVLYKGRKPFDDCLLQYITKASTLVWRCAAALFQWL
jgi:hypothetical protein